MSLVRKQARATPLVVAQLSVCSDTGFVFAFLTTIECVGVIYWYLILDSHPTSQAFMLISKQRTAPI